MMANDKIVYDPIVPIDPIENYIDRRLTKLQLSEYRKAKQLTQKELAELSGLSSQCISDIESPNIGNPTLKSLMKYLDALGLEMCFKKKER